MAFFYGFFLAGLGGGFNVCFVRFKYEGSGMKDRALDGLDSLEDIKGFGRYQGYLPGGKKMEKESI